MATSKGRDKQAMDAAFAALTADDMAKAEPDDSTGAKVALSVRFDRELLSRLAAEAERRGATPSQVVRDLVDRGLTALDNSPLVRLADVHAAIDRAVRPAA